MKNICLKNEKYKIVQTRNSVGSHNFQDLLMLYVILDDITHPAASDGEFDMTIHLSM